MKARSADFCPALLQPLRLQWRLSELFRGLPSGMRLRLRLAVEVVIALALGGGLQSEAIASERMTVPVYEVFPSTRANGMGGATSAVADDGDALFTNPAGIGREDGDKPKSLLRGAAFPSITLGVNQYTRGLYNVYNNGGATRDERLEKTILASGNKEVVYGRFTALPYFTIGHFQLGLFVDDYVQGYLEKLEPAAESEFSTPEAPKTVDTRMKVEAKSSAGAIVGFSLPYKNTGMSLGMTARYATRASLYRNVEMASGVARKSSQAALKAVNKTRGLAIDSGVLYRSSKSWAPAFALVFHDVGDAYYRKSPSGKIDEVEKMNIVTGLSARPPLGKMFGAVVSFEAHHLNDKRVALRDKMRFGTEFLIGSSDTTAPLKVRFGHNLSSPSVGVSADLIFLHLDFATYREILNGPNGRRKDTRYLLRTTVDLRT